MLHAQCRSTQSDNYAHVSCTHSPLTRQMQSQKGWLHRLVHPPLLYCVRSVEQHRSAM
jgi:hypothetical protein